MVKYTYSDYARARARRIRYIFMKLKFFAVALAAAAAALCLPALSGCAQDTGVEYTLYDSEGEVIRTDLFAENEEVYKEWQSGEDYAAPDPAPEGFYYVVSGYSGSPEELVIPAEINGAPVRSVAMAAFYTCRSITSVVIEEGVDEVGQAAFALCQSLRTAVLPAGLDVAESMFGGCESLESVVLPEGATSVGHRAFESCAKLVAVGEEGETGLNLPSTLTFLGGNSFYGCTSLEGAVAIPEGVTRIYQYSFGNCTGITSVSMGDGVTRIDEAAFGGCRALEEIEISSSLTRLDSGAFSYCEQLGSVYLPDSLQFIGQLAFQNSGVTSVRLPEGKGAWLYSTELEEDDPETDEDESEVPGDTEAVYHTAKVLNFRYSSEVAYENRGYVPSTELSDGEKAAGYLTMTDDTATRDNDEDCMSAFWYFVEV